MVLDAGRVKAEVFCGGGMPSNNHVSFFVVWQAVESVVNPPLPGDQHIFLPWVAGPHSRNCPCRL